MRAEADRLYGEIDQDRPHWFSRAELDGGKPIQGHAWFQAGRIFTMNARVFNDRTVCHKWAAKQRPAKEDRLVLACTKCPVSRKSKRRAIRWGHVARELGVTLPALRAAIETERRRN